MRVGILGGGQLGRMLAERAPDLGLSVLVVDPNAECSAASVTDVMARPFDDPEVLEALERCDVVTYEFEGVPLDVVRELAAKVDVHPSVRALEVVRDRLSEKSFLRDLGVATAAFCPIETEQGLEDAVRELGFPSVLKTRLEGYDGKGQWVLSDWQEVHDAWSALEGRPAILEAFVPFDRELSLIAVRDASGGIQMWAPTENAHVGGILRISRSPAQRVSESCLDEGGVWIERICDALDYRGVIAVELFEVEGRWLVNEIACRVHNSGHWTIEGAATSQFENHMRAVARMPLGPTDSLGSTAMVNLIGAVPPASVVPEALDARLHDYDKAPRPLRKVGHITLQRRGEPECEAALRYLVAALDDPDLHRAMERPGGARGAGTAQTAVGRGGGMPGVDSAQSASVTQPSEADRTARAYL